MGILFLVRHGQASFGAADYDVLSDLGRGQARRLGAVLSAPATVVHGGMRRQADTASELVAAGGWSVPVEVDKRWAEFDHLAVLGRYADRGVDGLDRRGFQELFERATAAWAADDDDEHEGIEGVESWTAFRVRSAAALDDAASYDGPVVVVTSGGIVAAVAAGLLGLSGPAYIAAWQRLNTVLVNTSVTRVLLGPSGRRLLTFNEHDHLDREEVTYR